MIALVDHEYVGDLHNARFDALHIIAHAGHENYDSDVGNTDNVNLVLTDTDSFDHYNVAAGRIEHHRYSGGRARQATKRAACGHAANVNAGIRKMLLHANAVAQNRPACIRARGINGNNSDAAILTAIMLRQLVHQRALACAGSAGQTHGSCASSVGKQFFKKLNRSRRVVLDRRNSAGQRTEIAGA